jgi:hypothetical protein
MADDAQITEEEYFLNEKRIHPFFYANRFCVKTRYRKKLNFFLLGTKVKSLPRFCEFF